jgi:hypothetical protein
MAWVIVRAGSTSGPWVIERVESNFSRVQSKADIYAITRTLSRARELLRDAIDEDADD